MEEGHEFQATLLCQLTNIVDKLCHEFQATLLCQLTYFVGQCR